VKIPAIAAPQNDFASAEAAAQLALDAEIRTTNEINDLLTLALGEKNYAAQNFLQWFVNEQVEEVATATTNLDIIKKAGPNVLMIEAYLSHANK
jgi:ferritin